MTIIFVLIPLGLVLAGLALWAFFWAVGDGQFDDLESPGWSVSTMSTRCAARIEIPSQVHRRRPPSESPRARVAIDTPTKV